MVLNKDNYQEFKDFISKHQEIIVKPVAETCGHGVEKIICEDNNKVKDIYNTLLNNKQILIEEVATQHPDMAKLHPNSINTIRIITIRSISNKITVVAAVVRIGTNYKVIDNFHNGGICAPINLETGKIEDEAVNKEGTYFSIHPTTKANIINYQIPLWNEVKQLVINAALEIDELKLIGWDVCIGPDKPFLIEGNQYPAHDLYRMIKTPNNVGMVNIFEKAINK